MGNASTQCGDAITEARFPYLSNLQPEQCSQNLPSVSFCTDAKRWINIWGSNASQSSSDVTQFGPCPGVNNTARLLSSEISSIKHREKYVPPHDEGDGHYCYLA